VDIKIYNTLTEKKELLVPLTPGVIKLYVCGITVYDLCHIGHARSMVAFDMVVRYLRWLGYRVIYVRNITDVDDKIIRRANELGEDSTALSERFIDVMHQDEKALNLLSPDIEPRATEYITEIIAMIEQLITKQHAYVADNGDVCFEVRQFPEYGKLSNRNIDELRAGERVVINEGKRDPLDFVLWKLSKPGEPHWSSPWGEGRPGWHIECSAMSTKCLGNHFDIHGGGMDLKFPHHENEIAQSEAATGEHFANIWMHAGLLKINGEKMSKSLGNFFTIQDVVSQHSSEVLRFFMLSSQYRKPLNYSETMLAQARSALETLYIALRGLDATGAVYHEGYISRFTEVMNDDFNTPEALAVLFELARDINVEKSVDSDSAEILAATLRYLANSLGVLTSSAEAFLQGHGADTALIEDLLQKREEARADKNWKESDRIRDQLQVMGIVIEDSIQGARWRKR
jgi:cysteinyl-tRNA synthetase